MILIQLVFAAGALFLAFYVTSPAVLSEGGVTVIEKQDRENRCD